MRRARPVLVLAVAAFAIGAILGAYHGKPSRICGRAAVRDGLDAARLREHVRGHQPLLAAGDLAERIRRRLQAGVDDRDGHQREADGLAGTATQGAVELPVQLHTRLFGRLSLDFTLPTVEDPARGTRIAWSRIARVPRPASRRGAQPRHQPAAARDAARARRQRAGGKRARTGPDAGERSDSQLAAGERRRTRSSGPSDRHPASRRQELEAEGVPADASVGLSGLELALDDRLRGMPGGGCLAGAAGARRRAAASRRPRSAPRSRRRCSARPSPRSPASTAGSSCCARPTGRSWRWPGSASTACSHRVRRSR